MMRVDIPMVAVCHMAFHRSIPARTSTCAVDLDLAHKHGIHRYGFHGIAYASLLASVPQQPTVHSLGSDSSRCNSAMAAPQRRSIGVARLIF